jgi:hypothetical protein
MISYLVAKANATPQWKIMYGWTVREIFSVVETQKNE